MEVGVNPDNLVSNTIADGAVFSYILPGACTSDDVSVANEYLSDPFYPWYIDILMLNWSYLCFVPYSHVCASLIFNPFPRIIIMLNLK